jgi:hypothetical protein
MSSPASPFTDHAAPVLAGEPTINDAQRADLWDAFHTKNADELAQHLQPLTLPDDFKHKLWQAKQQSIPAIAPVDKVTAAMKQLAQVDSQVLEVAEAHPNVLKAMTSAATTPEKEAGVDSGASSSKRKGDAASALKKPAPLAQPPRPDGLEPLPSIPDGHHRILSSDGGIHDIPVENLDKAREIDPRLHVLNP